MLYSPVGLDADFLGTIDGSLHRRAVALRNGGVVVVVCEPHHLCAAPMSKKNSPSLEKNARFETLESRLVMSAQALTDMPDIAVDVQVSQQVETTAISLDEVHNQTGVNHVYDNYGFEGDGQTVVVIDSGIAWDHYALGGGYGENYRVVGGWDFAENDANPFDDGGAGYHGTHVSGIIGSSDRVNRGVASGVDLVGLRVFDDNGNGSLAWVEQALQWVHDNKDNFRNPITTVNLSIGTNWNASTVPDWANLEEEFAQLEADGIFISVAAGNSFANFKTVGVSYPAVSDHVVPVASHGSDGQLSDFSQRNENVLVAPGESIRSTVPGHLMGNAVSSKFLGASGTSMAAPYVAGASVLVREAMQFMGYEDVDQAVIYQKLQSTADKIYDSLTGLNYNKINLQSAVESIIADQYGDSLASATDIGVLNGGEKLNGTIGTFGDKDVISFQAGRTGQMTFSFAQTHDLNLAVQSLGNAATVNGNTLTMNVVAGQKYTLQLSTLAGIGHYSIQSTIQTQTISADGLGTVFAKNASVNVDGTTWYQVTAGRDGQMALRLTPLAGQTFTFEVYDSQQNLLGTATQSAGVLSVNVNVSAGQNLFLKLDGQGTGSLAMQNLVSLQGGVLNVHGTNLDNTISVQDGTQIKVTVDGFEYSFERSQIQRVQVWGYNGQDTLNVDHVQQAQSVQLKANQIFTFGGAYQVIGNQFTTINYHAQVADAVTFLDSAGDDTLVIGVGQSQMTGQGFQNTAYGMKTTFATATAGNDSVVIQGTSGVDNVYSTATQTTLNSANLFSRVSGFDNVLIKGGGGNDSVVARGSSAAERLIVSETQSRFESSILSRKFEGFRAQQFYGDGGDDSAQLYGGQGQDSFFAYSDRTVFQSQVQSTFVKDFGRVNSYGSSEDFALLHDTAGSDQFYGDMGWSQMSGVGYQNQAIGFGTVIGRSTGGGDTSQINTSIGGSQYVFDGYRAVLNAGGYQVRSVGFAAVNTHSSGLDLTGGLQAYSVSTSSVMNQVSVYVSHQEVYQAPTVKLKTASVEKAMPGTVDREELADAVFGQMGGDQGVSYLAAESTRRSTSNESALDLASFNGSGFMLEVDAENALVDQLYSRTKR